MNDQIYNSKRLAYLLRHSDLPDRNGWVRVGVLLYEMSITLPILHGIVAEDTKGRFEFSENESSVRALYGHSIDVDLELEPTTPPMILYHGTAEKYLENIIKDGLKPRKRNYVHLSETIDMAMQVGARHGKPIILLIDTETMINVGYKFYKALSGVWLTSEVPARFYKITTDKLDIL